MAQGDEAPSTNTGPQAQKVSDVISTYRPCRRFRPDTPNTHVTSLDFDDSGELAIVSRDDDTLQIYNCREGKHAKELKSQKYGVHLARFTHHAQSILYASTKVDDTIRYLSTHDNTYIRYYKGHTEKVTCIAVNPSSDGFVSCSLDNTVRFWALNSPNAQGQLNLHAPHFATYDPSASVIAVASPPTQTVLLYDVRMYDRPPFVIFDLKEHEQRFNGPQAGRNWSKIELSNDGKSLLVATSGPGHFVLDAYEGQLTHFLPRSAGRSERQAPGEGSTGRPVGQGDATFSPDGRYVVGGSGKEDGLLVWDLKATPGANKVAQPFEELPMPQNSPGRCEIVGYNPRTNMICTADKDLLMWLPDPELAP